MQDRQWPRGAEVALLVNGLGAMTPMELAILARAAIRGLRQRGLAVVRAWSGTFLSALDMPGFSLSVMSVNSARLAQLDAATSAPAWPGLGKIGAEPSEIADYGAPAKTKAVTGEADEAGPRVRKAALAVAEALVAAESKLTDLDSVAGDGDLGSSMKRAAEAVRALPPTAFVNAASALDAIAAALRRAVGGSSGPFYAVAILRASRGIAGAASSSPRAWANAFVAALDSVGELGGARPGDRMMLDALRPAADAFRAAILDEKSAKAAWRLALVAAEQGVEATRSMHPRLGRASYLGDRVLGHPDAGAAAVLEWMRAIGSVLE